MPLENINAPFAIQDNNAISDAQKIGVLQNNKDREEQRQQRLYEQQKTNQWRNQGIISDDLNFDKYKTGEQAIDGYAQSELNKIQKEALTNHINDDPAQLEYWLTQRLVPLSQWHNMAQGAYKNLTESMQDFNKTYTGSDFGAVKKIGYQQLQKDLLDVDEQGNVTRKNTEDIHPTDYNALFQSAPVLAATSNDPSAFGKFFTEYPKDDIHNNQYTNKKGNIVDYRYSGIMPRDIGEYVTDEDNRPIGVRLKGQEMPAMKDASGKPAIGLTDDVWDKIVKNPQARQAALGMWYNSPEYEKAQKSYLLSTGQPIPEDAEKRLMSKFLYDKGAKYINHPLSIDDKQTTPKITINAGSQANQQAQMTGNWANSVVSAAANNDNATVNKLIDQMYSGNGERKLMGTYTKVENGQPMLYIRTQNRKAKADDDDDTIDEQIVGIPANSPNAEALLLGQFQSIMGSNTKAEALPFAKNPVVPTVKPKPKSKYTGVPDGGF